MLRIEFKQGRRYKGPLSRPYAVEIFDAEYLSDYMISGPFEKFTVGGKPARTAMYAFLDQETGKFSLEARVWNVPERRVGSHKFGILDNFAYKRNGTMTPVAGEFDFREAKARLRQFEDACMKEEKLSEIMSSSWIDNHYAYAKALTGQLSPSALERKFGSEVRHFPTAGALISRILEIKA